ncbi:DUF692 family multinuclear iron-containing protein [Blastomonas sp.]|uniref:MNIO family bufferin maturase n=1 Tax=Blastomonas sp. TaxID=1909299 RepID=UPI003593D77F
MTPFPPDSLPHDCGIGLKPEHYHAVLDGVDGVVAPAWVEVHPQNYFCAGGPPHRWLSAIAERLPLSFHSVGLSIGTAQGLDDDELDQLALLCARYAPASVSDHLSWSGNASDRYPDLLPIPYTSEALALCADQIGRVQDRLQRCMLIENPSRYLAFAGDEMDEVSFLHALCRRSGCSLLLDINNIEVSCTNLGLDPTIYVDAVDPALVGEVHLAGHATEMHDSGPLLIDDHGSAVSALTWQLFARFVGRAGAKPILIEWDTNLPDFSVLMAEVAHARSILADLRAVAA